ncbi:MAG: metal ABC transporter solute-binding protein, Zn/Mn family [Pirellulaceae bacterium]
MQFRSIPIVLLLIFILTPAVSGQRKVAVCSTTQIADFTRQIVGDDWEVLCVLGPGQDPHNYDPRIEDTDMVARADLCLHNGWHLEGGEWMQKLADTNSKPLVTCVQGVLPLQTADKEGTVNDPHAWFAPSNAAIYVRNILAGVSKIDPENAHVFQQRAELYMGQLNALDLWIKNQVVQIPAGRRVLVTHHDAFGYFCDTYGFQAASPAGWTTEEIGGIGLDRRQEIVETIRDIGVPSIFVETSLDQRMISEIARDAGVEIGGNLYSDAMGGEGTAGETYIGMMRENVLTIVAGLK